MKKPHPKKQHYEKMMFRATMAIKSEFYLEASWYVYAILEDRLMAALMASGGARDKKGKSILMLGPKVDLLEKRKKNDALLRAYFDSALIDSIIEWKDDRNHLMHAMADAKTPLQRIDKSAYLLAVDGRDLIKRVCRSVRLLKRNRHHVPTKP